MTEGKASEFFLKYYKDGDWGYVDGYIQLPNTTESRHHAFLWEIVDGALKASDGVNGDQAIKYFDYMVDEVKDGQKHGLNIVNVAGCEIDKEAAKKLIDFV